MPVDPKVVAQAASQFNVVPALVWAIGEHNQSWQGDDFEHGVQARSIASRLSQAVQSNEGSVERALASVLGGDPNAADSPTNPIAGSVAGALGLAGSHADYGMEHMAPSDPHAFSAHATDVHQSFDSLASLGGVVTAAVVQAFGAHVQRLQPRATPTGAPATRDQHPPVPSGPPPENVARFQQAASALGISADHIINHFGFASSMTRKLAGRDLSLEDYAPMAAAGLDQHGIQQYINAQPHPIYPEVTLGAYHAAYGAARLHAWKVGRFPYPSEAAQFAAQGGDVKHVAAYYDDLSKAEKGQTVQPTKPKANQEGARSE